jgi:ferredoxin-NADP reductase
MAKIYRCQVKEIRWVGGDGRGGGEGATAILSFVPQVPFAFEPGQFLSLQVPNKADPKDLLWRAYSFSLPRELARKNAYELCIKKVAGGQTASYLNQLRPGDWISVRAPYGEFTLRTKPGRGICLISTGTGVAPLRAMALSKKFSEAELLFGIAILGFRTFDEVTYSGDFERVGLPTTYAISRSATKLDFPFYNGRVTDVLKRLKSDFPWKETDFYLCGNGEMIRDVTQFLKSAHGVADSAIIAEAFEPASLEKKVA